MTRVNFEASEDAKETMTKVDSETYFDGFRCHFIKFLIHPSIATQIKFTLKMDKVPPVINSLASGDILYNSEHIKDSKILKNRDKLYGNQELLMYMMSKGELKLEKLNEYSNNELAELCRKLEFKSLSRLICFNIKLFLLIQLSASVFQLQQ